MIGLEDRDRVEVAESPLVEVVMSSGELEEIDMEFRLLYSGSLPTSANRSGHASDKQRIRSYFHPQLRELWMSRSNLRRMAQQIGLSEVAQGPSYEATEGQDVIMAKAFDVGIGALARNWQRDGYQWVPLVTEEMCLRCAIEVLFLRPEKPGSIFGHGDIDGRLKTLFDALRLPANLNEAGGRGPQADETPFFSLLADDKLITDVTVTTDQLLLMPGNARPDKNEAFLVIDVKLEATKPMQWGWVFS